MTEKDIQRRLIRNLAQNRNILIPNFQTGPTGAESDLLMITPSKCVTEIEIKISKSDFYREMKYDDNRKFLRHQSLRAKEKLELRHFYFAMPLELAKSLEGEIPEYAGLIGMGEVEIHYIKKAPVLKGSHCSNETLWRVTNSMFYRLAKSEGWKG